MANEISTLITNVGGLGACVAILCYFGKYAIDRIVPTLDKFDETIHNNTVALTTLAERIKNLEGVTDHENE